MGKIVDGIYYDSKGKPSHSGIVKVDDKIYYAQKNGKIVKDQKKTIHHGMANGLVQHGSYYFDKDGVIDLSSFKKKKKSSSSSKKKKGKIDQKRIILACVIALIVIFTPLGIKLVKDRFFSHTDVKTSESDQTDVVIPKYENEPYLCSAALEKYYKGDISLDELIKIQAAPYSPLYFKYSLTDAVSASLVIGEDSLLSDGAAYELEVDKKEIEIDNLKTGTTYYYGIKYYDSEGLVHETKGSFKTADTNRFVSLPGVQNTRDVGGYNTLYGRKIKQGLLIRGSELDGLVEGKYFLTDTAAAEQFGFVYEFDLRSRDVINTEYVSRLGKDVTHKFYNAPKYAEIFSNKNFDILKQIFTDLAKAENYPMYMHCTHGTERTGTIVFLLQGLLGVSEEDLRTEYRLSGLSNKSSVESNRINAVFSGLLSEPGENINEKIVNFLTDTVGVTKEQIQSIRSIFLENE